MQVDEKPSQTVTEGTDRRRKYTGPMARVSLPMNPDVLAQVDAQVTVTTRRTDVLNALILRGLQSTTVTM